MGGAVRDALLQKPVHDLDFAVPAEASSLARRVAKSLGAAYYRLDDERDTARVVLSGENGSQQTIDFAAFRGPDLESDLRGRDFTINAMAVERSDPQHLIDPLGGAADLRNGVLRDCSPSSMADDPIRVLRAVRLASAFNCRIDPSTLRRVREAAPSLSSVSAERLRDELFRILEGPKPAKTLRALDALGALGIVLPELANSKGVRQSPPHIWDVWTHTLSLIDHLDDLLSALQREYSQDKVANLNLGLLVLYLGRYREAISSHVEQRLNPQRSVRGLLFLAGLYHDVAKPDTWQIQEGGRIRNFGHEQQGALAATQRGQALQLSGLEIARLASIVRNHMRIHQLAQEGKKPSRRAIYRYFRDTGNAGIDICLLSLADTLATYGPGIPTEVWRGELEVCRYLMESLWEKPAEAITPPVWLNGNDLQEELGLHPGPAVGRLLEALREAGAAGKIHSREEALDFARLWLQNTE